MGAGYSSSVDSILVFPAPPSSYSVNTQGLLWLKSSSITKPAVPAFLIKPKPLGSQAKFAVRATRQAQRQPQQIQQRQEPYVQQLSQHEVYRKEYGYKQQQKIHRDRGLGRASSRKILLRGPQFRRSQQREQKELSGSHPLHQGSRHQQHHGVRRSSVQQHHTLAHPLPGLQQQFFEAHVQHLLKAVRRKCPRQRDIRARRCCSSASSSTGSNETAKICSDGSLFPRFLSVSAADCDVRWSSRKGCISERCRFYSFDSNLQQQQQRPREMVVSRKQQGEQANERQSRLIWRRCLSWACFSERKYKPEQEFCMLYFHGNACDANMMRAWLQTLADEVGVTILIFEYPGYGLLKEFRTSSRGVDLCARIAFEYIVKHLGYPVENVILCGRSIGTGAAAWMACELGQSGLYAGGLVLITPFVSLASLAADWIKAPAVLTEYLVHNHWNTEDALRRIPNVPLCIIHGQMDSVIPIEHSKRLMAAAAAPQWLRVVHMPKTADHDVGGTFSSLLLDVVGPLQLFLGKVAAAMSRRKVKPHMLWQAFGCRKRYVMRHHVDDHSKVTKSHQRNQEASSSSEQKRRSQQRQTLSRSTSDALAGSDARRRPTYNGMLPCHSAQQKLRERHVQPDQQQMQQHPWLEYARSTQIPCAVHAASSQPSLANISAGATAATPCPLGSGQRGEKAVCERTTQQQWTEEQGSTQRQHTGSHAERTKPARSPALRCSSSCQTVAGSDAMKAPSLPRVRRHFRSTFEDTVLGLSHVYWDSETIHRRQKQPSHTSELLPPISVPGVADFTSAVPTCAGKLCVSHRDSTVQYSRTCDMNSRRTAEKGQADFFFKGESCLYGWPPVSEVTVSKKTSSSGRMAYLHATAFFREGVTYPTEVRHSRKARVLLPKKSQYLGVDRRAAQRSRSQPQNMNKKLNQQQGDQCGTESVHRNNGLNTLTNNTECLHSHESVSASSYRRARGIEEVASRRSAYVTKGSDGARAEYALKTYAVL